MRIIDDVNIEELANYRGFSYMVCAYDIGHRCGYVLIPKNHKYYNVDYQDIDIEVHGGLTFSNHYWDDDDWWLGFDCAHLGDKKDLSIMSDEYKNIFAKYGEFNEQGATVKDKKYVSYECKRMIDQIIDGRKEDD